MTGLQIGFIISLFLISNRSLTTYAIVPLVSIPTEAGEPTLDHKTIDTSTECIKPCSDADLTINSSCDFDAMGTCHCVTPNNPYCFMTCDIGGVMMLACQSDGGSATLGPTTTPTQTPDGSQEKAQRLSQACVSINDWSFKVNGQSGRGCGWVGNYPYERCLISTGAKEACGQSCCGINDPNLEPSIKTTERPTLTPSGANIPIHSNLPNNLPTEISSSAPTTIPSILPSTLPTKTFLPTPTPILSSSPSNLPTKKPSPAPSPTMNCPFSDNLDFHLSGYPGRGCAWVGNSPDERCLMSTGAKQACKKSCCGINNPIPKPTKAPAYPLTSAPAYPLTSAPTMGPDPLERLRYTSLPITTSPGGRCMDGTMAGYYIREGNDPNVFVINMKGGGHCADPVRCADRARSKKGSSRYFPGSMKGTDFLDSNCARNPRFCHATHVHIPYCTSDMHRGTSEPSNDGLWHSQYYFDGHSNFMAIVDRLILAEGLKNSSNMKVLLVGNSAGAVGVYFNIDKLKERIPLAVVKGVPVAGWLPIGALEDDLPPIYKPSNFTMFVAGLRGNPFYQFIQNGGVPIDFYQMKGSLPADCLDDYNENEWWACAGMNQAYRYIKAPLFHVHTLYDNTQIYDPQNGGTPKDPVSFSDIHNVKQYIGMIGRATRAGLQQVLGNTTNLEKNQTDGIFAASCLSHGTEYAVTIDGGYNWQDIVTDWFFENGRLTDYHRQVELCTNEDDYELPCNSNVSCKYRPSMLVETCKQAMANNGCLNETGTEQCLKCVKRFRRSILGAGCSPLRKAEVIIPEICEDANSVNRSQ